jgi:hypothetical protein
MNLNSPKLARKLRRYSGTIVKVSGLPTSPVLSTLEVPESLRARPFPVTGHTRVRYSARSRRRAAPLDTGGLSPVSVNCSSSSCSTPGSDSSSRTQRFQRKILSSLAGGADLFGFRKVAHGFLEKWNQRLCWAAGAHLRLGPALVQQAQTVDPVTNASANSRFGIDSENCG